MVLTHGFFVWGSYLVSAAVLVGLTLYLVFDLRRQKKMLAGLEAQDAPRRRRPSGGKSAGDKT